MFLVLSDFLTLMAGFLFNILYLPIVDICSDTNLVPYMANSLIIYSSKTLFSFQTVSSFQKSV